MKKRIVLLTLCCISLLCIGYPLSKKISSSKDKTVQVSETDNTKTSAVNLPQEDNTKNSVSKDKNTSESTTAPESTDSIDSSETNNTVNNNDSTAPSAAESLNNSGNIANTANLIQGHDNIQDVINSPEPFLSVLIGRYGNRIKEGKFYKLDELPYTR